ncbi:hypothetical protein AAGS61_03475 [Lysinibacillus sp. KU-BSD001]
MGTTIVPGTYHRSATVVPGTYHFSRNIQYFISSLHMRIVLQYCAGGFKQ